MAQPVIHVSPSLLQQSVMQGQNAYDHTIAVRASCRFAGVPEEPPDDGVSGCPGISIQDNLPDSTQGSAYSGSVVATGGHPPYTYSVIAGGLPTGTSLNSATGVVSGTTTTPGTYNATIRAVDSRACTGTVDVQVIVTNCPTITLDDTLPDGTVGVAYSGTVAASGGVSPYTYAVTAGALPAGLSLNATTGAITGTPSAAETASFTITATDANGCVGSRVYDVQVYSNSDCSGCVNTTDAEYSRFCENCHHTSIGGNCTFSKPSSPCWLLTISGVTGEHSAANGTCVLNRISDCTWRGFRAGYTFDMTRPGCDRWRITATGTSSFSVDVFTYGSECIGGVSTGFSGGSVAVEPCRPPECSFGSGSIPTTVLVSNTPVTSFRAPIYYAPSTTEYVSRTKCYGKLAFLCPTDGPFTVIPSSSYLSECGIGGPPINPWSRVLYAQSIADGGCLYGSRVGENFRCTPTPYTDACDWNGMTFIGAELYLFRWRRIWTLNFFMAFRSCPESAYPRRCGYDPEYFAAYYKIWTPTDPSPLGTYKAWCADTSPATMVLS